MGKPMLKSPGGPTQDVQQYDASLEREIQEWGEGVGKGKGEMIVGRNRERTRDRAMRKGLGNELGKKGVWNRSGERTAGKD